MHGSCVQKHKTHLSLMRVMQGESLAAQPATLLTRLTGLATLQVRRCGHWQEVRSVYHFIFEPYILTPAAPLSTCGPAYSKLDRKGAPVLASSAAAAVILARNGPSSAD